LCKKGGEEGDEENEVVVNSKTEAHEQIWGKSGDGHISGPFFSSLSLSLFYQPPFFIRDTYVDEILGEKIDEAAIQMVSLKVELNHGLELPLLDSIAGDVHYMGIMCTRF